MTTPIRRQHLTEKRAAANEAITIRHNLNRSDVHVEVWAENLGDGTPFLANIVVGDDNTVTVRMFGPERDVKVTVSDPPAAHRGGR